MFIMDVLDWFKKKNQKEETVEEMVNFAEEEIRKTEEAHEKEVVDTICDNEFKVRKSILDYLDTLPEDVKNNPEFANSLQALITAASKSDEEIRQDAVNQYRQSIGKSPVDVFKDMSTLYYPKEEATV